ncbi:MAG TPA: isoprenylcysteine carboxylmethyltransferase family protein [Usitatibacter sp.]|nr:isoprenylcysteine carboxylmethyltransferase family protein [Usitatibacter sp.]
MDDWLRAFGALPAYGLGGLVLLLLYGLQAEVRFGAKARSHSAGPADRGSSVAVSVASLVVVFGFVLAMKAPASAWIPAWFGARTLPLMPAMAWGGVAIGVLGLLLRLWSVLTLRERYTRTLLTQEGQRVERGGPYRWVRHPGYLGSLLVLNGIALASGNWVALLVSALVTIAAYTYRIRAEDEMLVAALGEEYASYRREVGALLPFTGAAR